MELKTDLAALENTYQKIMSRFTDPGKEPEAKARLRHLFHNQLTFVSGLAPEPEDWNAWTEECIQKEDWPGLCRVLNQRSKCAMMPVVYGGYNYEKNFHWMLVCFACGNLGAMERILPPDLAQVKNCYDPLFPAAAHLLIGLWYKDKNILDQAVPEAERFLTSKKANQLGKAMVSFLLDLAREDMEQAGKDLLAVCKGYFKDKRPKLGIWPFCVYAHGLYVLAQLLLPEETFRKLELPKDKTFLPGFARWRREHPDPDRSLWFHYPESLAILEQIYEAPPARLVLRPPAPEDKKQEWLAHGVKWVDNYVDELWEMGVGRA